MADFTEKQIDTITRAFLDEGKIIEAGWHGFKSMTIPANAPTTQVNEMRIAFFGGAQHLYTSILRALEDGDEPTDNDLSRMGLIDKELRDFINDFQLKHLPTEGTA